MALFSVLSVIILAFSEKVSAQGLCGSTGSGPCLLNLGSRTFFVNSFQSRNAFQVAPPVFSPPPLAPSLPRIPNFPGFPVTQQRTPQRAPQINGILPGLSRVNELRRNYYVTMFDVIQREGARVAKSREIQQSQNQPTPAPEAAPALKPTPATQPTPSPTPQPLGHVAPAPGAGCNVACVTGDQQLEFVCPADKMPVIRSGSTTTSSNQHDNSCSADPATTSASTCVDGLTPTYIQIACDQKFNKMAACSLYFQKTRREDIYLLAPECSQRLQWECLTITYDCVDPNTYTPQYDFQ